MKISLLSACALLLCAPVAQATQVYAYQGNNYFAPGGNYTTNMFISGTFSVANPLAANLFLSDIRPLLLSFQYADGIINYSSANPNVYVNDFRVTTNENGRVVDARIWLETDSFLGFGPAVMMIGDWNSIPVDYVEFVTTIGGTAFAQPGKWGPEFDPPGVPSVPEPGTIGLAVTGFLAIVLRPRRRAN